MTYYRRRKAGASCGTSAGYLPAAVTDMEQYQAKTPGVLWSEGHWEVGDFSVSPIPNLCYCLCQELKVSQCLSVLVSDKSLSLELNLHLTLLGLFELTLLTS